MRRAKRMFRPRVVRFSGRGMPEEAVRLSRRLTDFLRSDLYASHLTPIPPWFGMEFSEVYDPTNFEAKPTA